MTVAERLSAPAAARDETPFHLGCAWFRAWDAAYLRPDQRGFDCMGLRLLDERVRLGPIRYRLRRSRTNVHTPRFDIKPGQSVPPDLPRRLLEPGIDVVTIDNLPADSSLLAAARRWGGRVEPHALAPVVDCTGGYAAWLARRSKRVRSRWPKLEAQVLGKLGMRFEVLRRFPDLPGLLAEIFEVEASGWKGEQGTAIRCSPHDLRFYTRLATEAAASGRLRVAVLREGDRITAFEYGILSDRRLMLLKVGYEQRYEDASIGHVMAALHIRACCEDEDVDLYDKLGNGMTPAAYKMRYADFCDTLYRVTLYGDTLRGQAVRLHDEARRRAKRLRDAWRERRQAARERQR